MTSVASRTTLLVLLLAGLGGNYSHLPLPGGGDLLFGSIAVLLVVRYYGPWWGSIAALFAGSYTYVLWHHPYGLLLAGCEACFVGLAWRRTGASFLLLDGLFWLLIGLPLLWAISTVALHLDSAAIQLSLLIQGLNGLANAALASVLIDHLPLHRWMGRAAAVTSFSLQPSVIHHLMAFVLFLALLLMAVNGQHILADLETAIKVRLQEAAVSHTQHIRQWFQQRLQALTALSQISMPLTEERLQPAARLMQHTFPDVLAIVMSNPAGTPLFVFTAGDIPREGVVEQELLPATVVHEVQMTARLVVTDIRLDRTC